MATSSLHELDFYAWTQQQVDLIKSGNLVDVDYEHVLEEIESMGASELHRHLKDNPSLHARLDEFIADSYIDSVLLAAKETGLDESAFPVQCPYAQDDLLNSEFYPDHDRVGKSGPSA